MAAEYEPAWDDFLEAYQKVKYQRDELQMLAADFIEGIDTDVDKKRYEKAYKEIIDG